jgi:hypothetical protein
MGEPGGKLWPAFHKIPLTISEKLSSLSWFLGNFANHARRESLKCYSKHLTDCVTHEWECVIIYLLNCLLQSAVLVCLGWELGWVPGRPCAFCGVFRRIHVFTSETVLCWVFWWLVFSSILHISTGKIPSIGISDPLAMGVFVALCCTLATSS